MDATRDYAYKLGCGRLLFEYGALRKLGAEIQRIGRKAYVIAGSNAASVAADAALQSLTDAGIAYTYEIYIGACSEEKGVALADVIKNEQIDVLIGIGGGRIMDLIKIAADIAEVPAAAVPTISATCAAYTPLSVVYSPDDRCRGTWYFRREVALVVCDLDILCAQPARYLAAGILDAMAKHVEINHHLSSLPENQQDNLTARLLANTIYTDLLAVGKEALVHLQNGVKSKTVERCIFHTIITTGLVSGIARGLYQAALGHAFYEAVRTLYPAESKPYLHGEVVAVGLILQEKYLHHEQAADLLRDFMTEAHMPVTLQGIGITDEHAAVRLSRQEPVPQFYFDSETDPERVQRILVSMTR